MAGKQTRNQKSLPHRQQSAVRVAASNRSTPKHQIPPEVSSTGSVSAESSELSTATNISSRISTSKFEKNEELPRKCLVVRRSAPKLGVTKTEIRLVIYNETQKKEGLRKMEYPALMDASEMLADRLRDLETKTKKDGYAKEKEVRRELEGERRPAPTANHQKEAVAKLKKVAPSLCNSTEVTTAEPIEPQSGSSSDVSVKVSPSKKQPRNRVAPVPRAPPTTVTSTSQSELKSRSTTEASQKSTNSKTPKRDNKQAKKKRAEIKGTETTKPMKVLRQNAPVPIKPIREEPTQPDPEDDSDEESLWDVSEVSSKPRRKPPPHAIREPKEVKNKVPETVVEPTEPSRRPKKTEEKPKDPIGPSEPRRTKKGRDQPQEPNKAPVPLCDRRDCCMQQPCVKKDPKSDQSERDEIPSGKRGKKNKTRTDIVLRDDTSTTNNSNVEDSLYVLKRIHKRLDSSNMMKNNPDKEKVKAQLEKIIRAIEGKLANGTKLNSDDLDRMKRIVAKTAELRGTVSLTTTVTITESVSVEDEYTDY